MPDETSAALEAAAQQLRAVDVALRLEGAPQAMRDRVTNRLAYGEADPQRIYYATPVGMSAIEWFTHWAQTWALVAAGKAMPGWMPCCPACGFSIRAVTVGARDHCWLQAQPCGCLFDVEPEALERPDEPS